MRKHCCRPHLLVFLLIFWLTLYFLLCLAFFAFLRRQSAQWSSPLHLRPISGIVPDYQCPAALSNTSNPHDSVHPQRSSSTNVTNRILLLVPHSSDPADHQPFLDFFGHFKVPIRVEHHSPGEQLLLELDGGHGRFALIVFADHRLFHALSRADREALRAYSARHSVGTISFLELPKNDQTESVFANFTAIGGQTVRKLVVEQGGVARIAKAGVEWSATANNETGNNLNDWTLFKPTLSRLRPVLRAETDTGAKLMAALELDEWHVLFGARPEWHWLVKITLMDNMSLMAPNLCRGELDRYIQVDIDDVFVGASGSLLLPEDVRALSITQSRLRQHIDNFHFTLGFSGYYFRHGDPLEVQGDETIVANANEFHWFPHMWRHNHPHEHSADYLLALMTQNRMFADNVGIRTNLNYAVAPQHSGVYPVYNPLYDAWKRIWSVRVTSTEEYPHLKTAYKRRAFVHANVTVLPRQTCGLFTHTQFFHAYPEGLDRFLANILGGDLFTALLMNPFSVFMTHQQNFANHRLGTFTFGNLVKFVECWTNLRLKWTKPVNLAELYLAKFPEERTLLYTNPCEDPRHRRTLPATFNCTSLTLPNLLILGPQKTGTSALALFLALHPNISTNSPIPGSFEELQFFAGPNYARGLEWYSQQFANLNNTHNQHPADGIIFEKTANYFDNPKAPEAVKALLPNAKLVVILGDPAQRAYSWYQHMKAHNNSAALKYSAEQIFMGNSTDEELLRLRRRCLGPGLYAHHLDRWLDHFGPSQLLLVDGDRLRSEPHFEVSNVFAQLQLPPLDDDLRRLIRYSPAKGFYCVVKEEKHRGQTATGQTLRCLGHGKGRHYEPISNRLRQHLESHFAAPNRALRDLLRRYHFPRIPSFVLSL